MPIRESYGTDNEQREGQEEMKSRRVMDCKEIYNQIVAFSGACHGIPRHYFERHETQQFDYIFLYNP